jgi:hypothetical protein
LGAVSFFAVAVWCGFIFSDSGRRGFIFCGSVRFFLAKTEPRGNPGVNSHWRLKNYFLKFLNKRSKKREKKYRIKIFKKIEKKMYKKLAKNQEKSEKIGEKIIKKWEKSREVQKLVKNIEKKLGKIEKKKLKKLGGIFSFVLGCAYRRAPLAPIARPLLMGSRASRSLPTPLIAKDKAFLLVPVGASPHTPVPTWRMN